LLITKIVVLKATLRTLDPILARSELINFVSVCSDNVQKATNDSSVGILHVQKSTNAVCFVQLFRNASRLTHTAHVTCVALTAATSVRKESQPDKYFAGYARGARRKAVRSPCKASRYACWNLLKVADIIFHGSKPHSSLLVSCVRTD
jgi:hypothetical protein